MCVGYQVAKHQTQQLRRGGAGAGWNLQKAQSTMAGSVFPGQVRWRLLPETYLKDTLLPLPGFHFLPVMLLYYIMNS